MVIKKNLVYFVDNILNFLVLNIIKVKDGMILYESMEDNWDNLILIVLFEYDDKEVIKIMGGGKVIDVI